MHRDVAILRDHDGWVELGWVAPRVLLLRFVGGFSRTLGEAVARRLSALTQNVEGVDYFADASLLKYYDIEARRALSGVLLAHPAKFQCFVVLTWAEGVSTVAQAFASLAAVPTLFVTDQAEFNTLLLRIAPDARGRLYGASYALLPCREQSES